VSTLKQATHKMQGGSELFSKEGCTFLPSLTFPSSLSLFRSLSLPVPILAHPLLPSHNLPISPDRGLGNTVNSWVDKSDAQPANCQCEKPFLDTKQKLHNNCIFVALAKYQYTLYIGMRIRLFGERSVGLGT